ncbi:MAG: S41 family peptidase [Muribaculaceae bacterium]|jgi:carboxyl-terminal processing protease|nr:S41 family peptidase [Muribaculaceae bacterium]
MRKSIKIIITAAIIAAIIAPAAIIKAKTNDDAAIARNIDIFTSLYKELNTFYVDSINPQKSVETAINAMLDEIDPYTEYIPAKDQDDFLTITTGEYGGIGSYIMQSKGSVYISEPYENSPAALAGLRAGDKIIKIDNDSVKGWESSKVSEHLKGQANTKIKVTVCRPYTTDSIKTFEITRKKIQINAVPYFGVVHENVGYIYLTTFNEKAPEEVKNALLTLKKNPAVKYIVIDLRGNGGGLLESAVQIVGMFVPKGTEVLQTRGRSKQQEKTYKTTQDPIDAKIPLAVLTDGNSASSSEIVAGSLQDLDRAVIIGSRSYGKGLVQTTRQLPFDGMLKVTIAKYYIPSGRLIQAIDYSHRNPDGSVARIPDSLTHVFKTLNGREVRDGGGITPDIKVDYPKVDRLSFNIIRDNWAFNFATKYASEHATIPSAEDFTITDSIYSEFKHFINPKTFAYDKVCEDKLKDLRESAEIEGYMTDSAKVAFASLDKLLKHDLQKDLDTHRKAISDLLAGEIQKRYYYQKGAIIQTIKDDEALTRAAEMFNRPGDYVTLLKIGTPKEKASKPNKKKK